MFLTGCKSIVFSAMGFIACCLAFAAILTASQAHAAEDDDCILDHCADQDSSAQKNKSQQKPDVKAAPKPDPANDIEPPSVASDQDTRVQPRGASRPGDFDFYVLSLSWSPGFCANGGRARSQCDAGANLGFVVHGLWPQYEHGFPSDCGPAGRTPSRIAVESAGGLFPDEGLARYEWRKHGTCSGKSPTDYFSDVRRAYTAITIPGPFQEAKQEQSWAPIDIERAFIASNPRLRPGMLAVACRHATLEEVRFCFSKDLRDFRSCPEVVRHDCRGSNITVPPIR